VAARLGNVLYWIATAFAILFLALAIYGYLENPKRPPFPYVWYVFRDPYFDAAIPEIAMSILAVMSYAFGRVCRYVLAGR
jgi:hypothetical protein